jgi:P27 family predicted phage terminase small subunit
MGGKGRRPIPDAVKAAFGLRNRYRLGGAEPKGVAHPPKKPDWLSKFAGKQWDRIIGEMAEVDLLSASDLETIAALCIAYEDLKNGHLAVQQAEEIGDLCPSNDSGGMKAHPGFTIVHQATMRIKALAAELGRTPCARASWKGLKNTGKKQETLEDFVNLKVKRA